MVSSELTCSVTALVLLEADDFKIPCKPGRDVDPDRADFGLGVGEISWIRFLPKSEDDGDGAMSLGAFVGGRP